VTGKRGNESPAKNFPSFPPLWIRVLGRSFPQSMCRPPIHPFFPKASSGKTFFPGKFFLSPFEDPSQTFSHLSHERPTSFFSKTGSPLMIRPDPMLTVPFFQLRGGSGVPTLAGLVGVIDLLLKWCPSSRCVLADLPPSSGAP